MDWLCWIVTRSSTEGGVCLGAYRVVGVAQSKWVTMSQVLAGLACFLGDTTARALGGLGSHRHIPCIVWACVCMQLLARSTGIASQPFWVWCGAAMPWIAPSLCGCLC